MKNSTKFKKAVFFGIRKDDKKRINMSAPSFDCEWYWSFGYLGNKNEHFHLDSYLNGNKNMYDCLIENYDLNPHIKDNLWLFCELSITIYTLKVAAEVLGRGGSHLTSNPVKDTIINSNEVKRINEEVLPALFDSMYDLFK